MYKTLVIDIYVIIGKLGLNFDKEVIKVLLLRVEITLRIIKHK